MTHLKALSLFFSIIGFFVALALWPEVMSLMFLTGCSLIMLAMLLLWCYDIVSGEL